MTFDCDIEGDLHLILEANVTHSRTKGCCSDYEIQMSFNRESLVPFLSCILTFYENQMQTTLKCFVLFLQQSLRT